MCVVEEWMCVVERWWSRTRCAAPAQSSRERRPARSGAVAVSLFVVLLSARAVLAEQPAVLVVSPQTAVAGWVDLDYLADLRSAGFEVDYTDSMADFTWDRIASTTSSSSMRVRRRPASTRGRSAARQPIYQGRLHRAGRALPAAGRRRPVAGDRDADPRHADPRAHHPLGSRSSAGAHRRPAEHEHDEPHAHMPLTYTNAVAPHRSATACTASGIPPCRTTTARTRRRCWSTVIGRSSCAPCRAHGPYRSI